MSKRYREALDRVLRAGEVPSGGAGATTDGRTAAEVVGTWDGEAPVAFTWRGHDYTVLAVLGHWREDAGWWRTADGRSVRIEQTDLWRVEARNSGPTHGVYELVERAGEWRLDRVWD